MKKCNAPNDMCKVKSQGQTGERIEIVFHATKRSLDSTTHNVYSRAKCAKDD